MLNQIIDDKLDSFKREKQMNHKNLVMDIAYDVEKIKSMFRDTILGKIEK